MQEVSRLSARESPNFDWNNPLGMVAAEVTGFIT